MRTDALSDVLLAVNDQSTPEAKALWHAIIALEERVDDGMTPWQVSGLLTIMETVLERAHRP